MPVNVNVNGYKLKALQEKVILVRFISDSILFFSHALKFVIKLTLFQVKKYKLAANILQK